MNVLVESLRKTAQYLTPISHLVWDVHVPVLLSEAADRIESLEAEVDRLRSLGEQFERDLYESKAEVDRLRDLSQYRARVIACVRDVIEGRTV